MTVGAGKGVLSVVLADPHRDQRERLRRRLDADPRLRVIATAAHRDAAARLLWELEPDAAVIEVGLLSACEFPLAGWGPIPGRVRLVAVGLGDDPYLASTLRAAGFAAYLAHDRLDAELCDVVAGRSGRFGRVPAPLAEAATDRFARPTVPSAGR